MRLKRIVNKSSIGIMECVRDGDKFRIVIDYLVVKVRKNLKLKLECKKGSNKYVIGLNDSDGLNNVLSSLSDSGIDTLVFKGGSSVSLLRHLRNSVRNKSIRIKIDRLIKSGVVYNKKCVDYIEIEELLNNLGYNMSNDLVSGYIKCRLDRENLSREIDKLESFKDIFNDDILEVERLNIQIDKYMKDLIKNINVQYELESVFVE